MSLIQQRSTAVLSVNTREVQGAFRRASLEVKDTVAASGNTLERSPSGAFHVPSFSHKWSQQLASLLQMREKSTKGNYSPPCNQQENAAPSEIVMIYTVMC